MRLLSHHVALASTRQQRFHVGFDNTQQRFLSFSEFARWSAHENLTASPHNHAQFFHAELKAFCLWDK